MVYFKVVHYLLRRTDIMNYKHDAKTHSKFDELIDIGLFIGSVILLIVAAYALLQLFVL